MKKIKIVAVIAALILGIGFYQFLTVISKPQEIPRTTVIVAAQDITANTVITAEMLMEQPIATEALHPHCIKSIDAAVGMVMASDAVKGEQILTDRLITLGEADGKNTSLAYMVDPGMRAVTINVGVASGLHKMLRVGNHVDVIVNYTYEVGTQEVDRDGNPTGETFAAQESQYVLQNLKVLALDNLIKKGTPEEQYSTITLMATPEQALLLTFSEYTSNLKLVLRSNLDEALIDPEEANQMDILDTKKRDLLSLYEYLGLSTKIYGGGSTEE